MVILDLIMIALILKMKLVVKIVMRLLLKLKLIELKRPVEILQASMLDFMDLLVTIIIMENGKIHMLEFFQITMIMKMIIQLIYSLKM